MMMERMSTDIYALKKQYARIKRRQQQQAMQLYIRTDKCPATRVLASQLNPSSSVINHLLLGRKPRGGARGYRPTSATTSILPGARPSSLFQSPVPPGSPARQRCSSLASNSTGSPGSSRGGGGSPWRAHVRQHRRNIARARAQLGFGDSEDREDEEEKEKRESAKLEVEEQEEKQSEENKRDDEQKEASDSFIPLSPDSSGTGSACEEALQGSDETKGAEVADVVVQLDSLTLESESNQSSPNDQNPDTVPKLPEFKPAPQVPLLPPPPSSIRHEESDSSERHAGSVRCFSPPTTPPPHHSSNSCISSSSPSTPSTPHSPTALPSLDQSSSDSPTLTSTPKPNSTSSLPPSSSANCLSALSPPASSTFYKTSSPSTPSLSSISSSSRSQVSSSPSTPGLSSIPKQQVFSPFPCVKQPRKSVAARNLGLYGPTSRTPTVHFPQLSRNLNRSSAAGLTGRR